MLPFLPEYLHRTREILMKRELLESVVSDIDDYKPFYVLLRGEKTNFSQFSQTRFDFETFAADKISNLI